MTSAHYSTVLDHPLPTVWALIRDFNNYPAYIEGVSESVIEDDRRGDEVGAVRRFCYLGEWVRQRLAVHSDDAHLLSYACIDPLPFPFAGTPQAVSPTPMSARCSSDELSTATAPLSNGRLRSRVSHGMPSGGACCSSRGFRCGRIRSRRHWPNG